MKLPWTVLLVSLGSLVAAASAVWATGPTVEVPLGPKKFHFPVRDPNSRDVVQFWPPGTEGCADVELRVRIFNGTVVVQGLGAARGPHPVTAKGRIGEFEINAGHDSCAVTVLISKASREMR